MSAIDYTAPFAGRISSESPALGHSYGQSHDLPGYIPVGGDDLHIVRSYFSLDTPWPMDGDRVIGQVLPKSYAAHERYIHRVIFGGDVSQSEVFLSAPIRGDVRLSMALSVLPEDKVHGSVALMERSDPVIVSYWPFAPAYTSTLATAARMRFWSAVRHTLAAALILGTLAVSLLVERNLWTM